ncbi:CPBP family intramembrane glutamic endopeptidase [Caldilinea sp.]|uniref:CPBP family intramembrane glutamic endopeptidase n=1 Tax=Caldilinea sp. TaxID=2293560 RepID=UPI002CFDC1E7|nr:CPBP family intramembrane metalloprotease [Caldilinea sp.]
MKTDLYDAAPYINISTKSCPGSLTRKDPMTSLKRHPLIAFFVLAYALPWLVWGTSIAEVRGLLSFHIPQPLAFWIGLTLATFGVAALSGGAPAVRDLLSRMVRWRVAPIWYVAALLLPGVLSVVAIGLFLALGGTNEVGVLLSLQALLPALLFYIFFFLLTEETAWRGFALPRLQAKYSALVASLILGVLWGFWHLPLVFIPGSFQATTPFIGFVLSAVATSVIATWLFNHSQGSVLIAAIFHAATDTTIAYSNVMTGSRWLFWLFIGVQWIAALAIIFVEGAAHFARNGDLRATVYPQEEL